MKPYCYSWQDYDGGEVYPTLEKTGYRAYDPNNLDYVYLYANFEDGTKIRCDTKYFLDLGLLREATPDLEAANLAADRRLEYQRQMDESDAKLKQAIAEGKPVSYVTGCGFDTTRYTRERIIEHYLLNHRYEWVQ